MANDQIKTELTSALYSGYIDGNAAAKQEYKPKLLINDAKRNTKVLTSILAELDTCDEFMFSVAFITNSGVATLINELKVLQDRGIKGKILASQYQNFTEPRALQRLIEFDNIEVRIHTEGNFHAKGYLFRHTDEYTLIIGSSNLTANALCANNEWNLKVSSLSEGSIANDIADEFSRQFNLATPVTKEWIEQYNAIYKAQREALKKSSNANVIDAIGVFKAKPNEMQVEALAALDTLRKEGKDRALLISATATGKTFLSAFDAKKFDAKKLLFVIHREKIAKDALRTYQRVFDSNIKMGLYTGSERTNADFIFCTVQTLSRKEHLEKFRPDQFDYIVMDEVHHAGAESYQRVLNYFKPKFLLGMSATPERTDGYNIFKTFDYNIAYELRLNKALELNMVAPFHYYGVTDILVDDVAIDTQDFNKLTSKERVDKIIEYSNFYGCDRGRIKGLIFCSGVEEAKELSNKLNERGLKTKALSGESSETEREDAIRKLESDDIDHYDYLLTRDIFNEGVDIPSVNQVILLRPTQSAIVYIQQLGRGLRKFENKDYLTVIDFIGDYKNNYLVPVALYGDATYNKDKIRRFVSTGSIFIPGTSTIDFDEISKDKIFNAINAATVDSLKDLKKDYELLKYKLGYSPMMMDFVKHGSRDPYLYVQKKKSYYTFLSTTYLEEFTPLPEKMMRRLEFFSLEICNGKRLEELIILKHLLNKKEVLISSLVEEFNALNYPYNEKFVQSAIRVINGQFLKEKDAEKFCVEKICESNSIEICRTEIFEEWISNDTFKKYLADAVEYGYTNFLEKYSREKYRKGFILYEKYSRKDVSRILCWEKNEESTMYGYSIKNNTCPIFVNYEKDKELEGTGTDYPDYFISKAQFHWSTRHGVRLDSKEPKAILDYENSGIRISLFVKKSNDESSDFYYIGDLSPVSCEQTSVTVDKKDGTQKVEPIVYFTYDIADVVDDNIYSYLTSKTKDATL